MNHVESAAHLLFMRSTTTSPSSDHPIFDALVAHFGFHPTVAPASASRASTEPPVFETLVEALAIDPSIRATSMTVPRPLDELAVAQVEVGPSHWSAGALTAGEIAQGR